MSAVYAEMLQQDAMQVRRKAGNRDCCGSRCSRFVHVMVVPDHHSSFAVRPGRKSVDICSGPNAGSKQGIERYLTGALRGYPLTRHQCKHAEYVEHRFVDSVGCQGAEAFKIVFVLELEGPAQHAKQVDGMPILQIEQSFQRCGRVCGIECSVAILVRGVHFGRASGAAFRVGLRENDGQMLEAREPGNYGKNLR